MLLKLQLADMKKTNVQKILQFHLICGIQGFVLITNNAVRIIKSDEQNYSLLNITYWFYGMENINYIHNKVRKN